MRATQHHELNRNAVCERLRVARNLSTVAGVVLLALALGAVSNSVVNPETWSSAYHALAASGAFVCYAGWFAVGGCFMMLVAAIIQFYLRRSDDP
jgi:hypothetical protein